MAINLHRFDHDHLAADAAGTIRLIIRAFFVAAGMLTRTCSPSKSHQTGTLCGCPSRLIVVKAHIIGRLKRSWNFSGMDSDIIYSHFIIQQPNRWAQRQLWDEATCFHSTLNEG
jgi:hypothetical protein